MLSREESLNGKVLTCKRNVYCSPTRLTNDEQGLFAEEVFVTHNNYLGRVSEITTLKSKQLLHSRIIYLARKGKKLAEKKPTALGSIVSPLEGYANI